MVARPGLGRLYLWLSGGRCGHFFLDGPEHDLLEPAVALLFYPAAMALTFYAAGGAIPLLGIRVVDGVLPRWDRALLGETPAVVLRCG